MHKPSGFTRLSKSRSKFFLGILGEKTHIKMPVKHVVLVELHQEDGKLVKYIVTPKSVLNRGQVLQGPSAPLGA